MIPGKTVYLHLRIVQMLLEAKPFLYQTKDGLVFYLGETLTEISANTDIPEHLAPPSHVFVDFDGESNGRYPASSIRRLIKGHIILASSPGPTINRNWKN